MFGLWSGMIIGFVTEYYTSNAYDPTLKLYRTCRQGAATNVIQGLALGYTSCIIPIFCIFSIWACICSGVGKPCGIIGLPPAAPGGTWARTGARTTSISRLGLNGCLTSRPGAPRGG